MVAGNNGHDPPTVKTGGVRDQQRAHWKRCGENVVLGEARHAHATAVKHA